MVRHILGLARAAMFVALLALVPTQAQAHAGHSHPPAATEQSAPPVLETSSAVSMHHRAATHVTAAVKALTAPEPGDRRGCSDNCCKSAMSCCLVLLVSPLETLLPPEQAMPFPYPASISSAGHDPDRLRRPPRSFT